MNHTLAVLLAATAAAASLPAQRLVAVASTRALYEIDRFTGVRTQIGTVSSNAGTTGGLAHDLATNIVYLTSTSLDSLFTLDVATGTATLVGPYGDSAIVMHGLEIDASTGNLYGLSSHNQGLYSIDKTTGAATLIGTSGLTSFGNLGYDPTANVMYATNSGTDSFYSVDLATGAQTLVGPLVGPTNPHGLAFDYVQNLLYLTCTNTATLYTIDRTTGTASVVGPFGPANLLGLVFLPDGGSITRVVHGCGTTTIASTGSPTLGGSVTTTLGNLTGGSLPFLGYGFLAGATPFCTCTVGHEWAAVVFGSTSTLTLPSAAAFLGVQVAVQGAELFGTGGCVAPQVTLTDTMVITIG